MTKIEQELQEAVDFDVQKGEKRQAYLKRLIVAVDELEDEEFSSLSKEAQTWAEAAAKASIADSQIPDFEEDDAEGEEEATEDEEAKPVKSAKKSPKTKGDGQAKAKKAPKAKSDQERTARPRGSLPTGRNKYVQEVLAKKPNATVDEIAKVLEKKGVEVPSRLSISTSRSSFRSALETMSRLGLLKESVDLGGDR